MKQIKVAGGVTEQWDGPWYGVRVVQVGSGAAIALDEGAPVPLFGSFSFKPPGDPFRRVKVTGVAVVQLAETPDDDLSGQVSVSPDSAVQEHFGPLSTADAQASPIDFDLRRPGGATALWLAYKVAAMVDALVVRRLFFDVYDANDQILALNYAAPGAFSAGVWNLLLAIGPTLTNLADIPAAGAGRLVFRQEVLAARMRVRFGATGAGVQLTGVEMDARWGRA